MSNYMICFSKNGAALGWKILTAAPQENSGSAAPAEACASVSSASSAGWELTECFGTVHESLADWTRRTFQPGNNLLFIGAAGIAVRAIAPYVREKQSDPAVVVMDEKANWCIPILSGHLGGANLLANKLAKMTGAQAAITTATDVRGVWAVDSWRNRKG